MKIRILTAALLGALLATGTANAATCTVTGKKSTTYTVEVSCASACFSGNDTNTIDSTTELFGKTGWILADKNDDATSGDQNLIFADDPFIGPVNDTTRGEWAIANPDNYSSVFMTLKAGNSFAAFLLNAATFMTGNWSSSRDLSHASIYYWGEPNPAPVPLPASGLLLLAGLGGLVAARRRKS